MLDTLIIEKIRAISSIVDVTQDFLDLKKNGSDYDSLCPFHDDRHFGNFKISARYNIYKCFSCGETGDAIDFLMKKEGMTFMEAIRWLGAKYSIDISGAEKYKLRKCKPHTPPPPLPLLELPERMITAVEDVSGDNLYRWMKSLSWNEAQRARLSEVWKMYRTGHGKDGHTIFWQTDEEGKLRTGKMMLYKEDGHRDKESPYNFGFIHSALQRSGYYNPDEYDVKTTYFGIHLLDKYPNAEVNIVESEKTALLCATYQGNFENFLWIATGGANQLNPIKLKPLTDRKRYICLYPDKDAEELWNKQVKEAKYNRINVYTRFMQDYWQPCDGDKADIADILVRLMTR